MASTVTSLSSITEDSTFGVEGEDLPPDVPRRRRSFERSRAVSASSETRSQHEVETLKSIHEQTPQHVQESAEIDGDTRSRRSSGRRSGSKRRSSSSRAERDSSVADEKSEERSERSKRKRRSSTGSSQRSSQESSRRERGSNNGSQTEADRSETSSSSRRNIRRLSSSSNRKSSNKKSETKKDLANASDRSQEEEKLKEMARSKSSRSSRRSSSISSERDTMNDGDELTKQTIVEERRHHHRSLSSSSSRRRSRHSRSSSRRSMSSSRHSSEWGSDADSSTQFSRNLDRRGAQHEFRRNGSPDGEDTASEDSDEERPGAYRVSTHSTNRVLSLSSSVSSDGHSFAISEENTVTDTTISMSIGPDSTSNSTMVRAEVARDMTEEIAAAREQGRVEVLASNRDEGIVVASVAQPSRGPKEEDARKRRRKKRFILFALCCCCCFFVMVCGGVGYVLLTRQEENLKEAIEQNEVTKAPNNTSNNSSELDAVISFDPPTAEDCASIANGTDVAGQEDMFTQYVDMHIEITTMSEADAKLLVALLRQQIDLNLIPFLIGCNDVVGNVIGNGVVESVSNETSPCLFQNNPLCLEVVLTVKIYLRREEDGNTVIEIMSEILLDEDLSESLELPPTVETAGVRLIVPSDFGTDVPTETPSWSPSMANKDNIVDGSTPTASPSVGPTPRRQVPINTPNPTREPTLEQAPIPTARPSPIPTLSPTLGTQPDSNTVRPTTAKTPSPTPSPISLVPRTPEPTPEPTKRPTPTPTAVPFPGSTPLPTSVPSPSPTTFPTPVPTRSPTTSPTPAPTVSPTETPSSVPSLKPSPTPSSIPSFAPSPHPSDLPSVGPSASPSLTPSVSPTMCTIETKVIPLFDAGVVDSYQPVSPGEVITSVQRFSCLAGASTDLGIIRYNEAECTVECLNTVSFSAIESYCSSNPAGGFTIAIPSPFGPFAADTQLYIGLVDSTFGLTCGAELPILNFDITTPIGCYADAQHRAMTGTPRVVDSSMTVQRCLDICFQAGFLYAGLENRRDCFCDNDYMRYGKVEDSKCNRNCVDGLKCGGDWRMSVYPTGVDGHDDEYTPVPSAAPLGDLGCWKEDPAMEIATLGPVWVVRCVELCESMGKAYAGLHNLDNRNKCYCGDAYDVGGMATTCDKDCAGSCGGTDSWNIYATAA